MTQLKSRLVVDAGNPAVRIEVMDANFQVRARGYGHIEEELPTGLYTVRYRAGDAIEESDIKIQPDQPLELLEPPKLAFGSSAPIEQTWTSHKDHQNHARRISLAPPLRRGNGAELFLFVRDLVPGGRTHPLHGMSLHKLNGTRLVDFEKECSKCTDSDQALWAGLTVAVDPGRYRLRLAFRRGQAIETMIVACPGWQSQYFLLRPNSENEPENTESLDLSSATQLMAPQGVGFDPGRTSSDRVDIQDAAQDIRLAELAHFALANQWRGFHTQDLNTLLDGKSYDPMLGILGLHLLMLRPEPNLEFAGQILERLRKDILQGFSHPDVEALGIEIARRQGKAFSSAPIESPPMLRRSWFLLLQASAEAPSLIASDSFSSQIADRVWGSGAWLTWMMPQRKQISEEMQFEAWDVQPSKKDDFSSIHKELEEFLPTLRKLIEKFGVDGLAKRAKLDRGEFALLTLLSVQLQTEALKSKSTQSDPLSLESLIQALGVPADRIQVMIIGLLAKLAPLAEQGKRTRRKGA